MDDIFKQAKKEISGSLGVTNEIRLDEDDANVNRTSLDKPFSLSSTHTSTSVPVAASINILPQIPVNKKPESQVEGGSITLFNSKVGFFPSLTYVTNHPICSVYLTF
jgi:hypothetical protein